MLLVSLKLEIWSKGDVHKCRDIRVVRCVWAIQQWYLAENTRFNPWDWMSSMWNIIVKRYGVHSYMYIMRNQFLRTRIQKGREQTCSKVETWCTYVPTQNIVDFWYVFPPPNSYLMTSHSGKWPLEKMSGGLGKIPSFSLSPGTWKNFEFLYRPL